MALVNLDQPIPPYLLKKKNIKRLIVYTSLFALLFINIYAPFGVTFWFTVNKWQLLFYSSLIILTGVIVVVISRIIMYHLYREKPLSYFKYFLWVGAEIFFMALFYALFELIFLHDQRSFYEILRVSMLNTALVLLLPYAVLWLYFSYEDKSQYIEQLNETPPDRTNIEGMFIPFLDEKGVLRISIKFADLLYLEANDNYVNIYHQVEGKIESFLLRNSLKNLESGLQRLGMVRCHRSYIVNFSRVRVIYKNSSNLVIELDTHERTQIPVSKNYAENIVRQFVFYNGVH
ncbi:MAG TPA: LytTR family DNA-binding domain-containing protein [Bacteroidales bacterium]|nr:LytTR family DNA-binding domain-containing protein [Bacteroidales bacterium]HOK98160.1 LytTR family DNA-binding domain-containing protein [Bacteroidales bacterium]HPO65261.1 LytTR family DNA-binding domain-containing protein [Bacteroidales bacterium]